MTPGLKIQHRASMLMQYPFTTLSYDVATINLRYEIGDRLLALVTSTDFYG